MVALERIEEKSTGIAVSRVFLIFVILHAVSDFYEFCHAASLLLGFALA